MRARRHGDDAVVDGTGSALHCVLCSPGCASRGAFKPSTDGGRHDRERIPAFTVAFLGLPKAGQRAHHPNLRRELGSRGLILQHVESMGKGTSMVDFVLELVPRASTVATHAACLLVNGWL